MASSVQCSASSMIGKNSNGTNLRQADWSNVAEDCCNQCNWNSECQAWTWIEGSHECWLKSWVPAESHWVSEYGVTSGLRSSTPTPAPTPAPTTSYVNACGCDCQWLGEDDCDRSVYPPAWSDDKCANRCRVANGITYQRCYYNQGSRADWSVKTNNNPTDTWGCDCQWMAKNWGREDDCKGGCDPSDCAYKCRQANPWGTCLADSTPTPASTPAPTTSYVDACGCDCQWLGQDDCVRSVDPPAWNDDKCSNRCRVANGITERRCYYNQGSRAVWTRKANNNPTDTSDCNCQWMASDYGLGDDCKGGCDPSDCAYKCRQANPWGTCLAD
jgi:hypothetical protein